MSTNNNVLCLQSQLFAGLALSAVCKIFILICFSNLFNKLDAKRFLQIISHRASKHELLHSNFETLTLDEQVSVN